MNSRRRFRSTRAARIAPRRGAAARTPRARRPAANSSETGWACERRLSWHAVLRIAAGIAGALAIAGSAAAQNLHYGMNTRVLTPQMADKMVELGAGVVR